MRLSDRMRVSNALDDIINALKKTLNASKEDLDSKDLPPVFVEVAACTPVAHEAFASYNARVASHKDEKFTEEVCCTLTRCKSKAIRLEKIFQDVIFESNMIEQYLKVAKGEPLEALMKEILRGAIELRKSPFFTQAVDDAKARDLDEALRKIEALPASLPENQHSHVFHNHGTGFINANTGAGPQNNNNGSGNQFNGAIGNYHAPAKEPEGNR